MPSWRWPRRGNHQSRTLGSARGRLAAAHFRPELLLLEERCTPSASPTVGAPVNVSHLTGHQREAAIAVDPADPQRLFAVSNTRVGGALFAAYSTDGGSSWAYADPSDGAIADSHDSLVQACCDPTAAFDEYGNLFLGYLSENSPQTVELALSTDGGQAFTRLAEFPRGRLGTDQPTVVTGPDGTGQQSVWVTFRDNDTPQVMVYGAQVTGLNVVGSFAGFGLGPASRTGNFGDIAVGPSGQVLVAYQSTGS